jgi:hypothetical protein
MTVEGRMPPQGVHNEGEDTHAPRATTPAQRRQQGQQHDAGNDTNAMQAKHQRNAGKRQRGTSRTFKGQLGNNVGATPGSRTA